MSGATFDHLKALVVEDNNHMRTLLRSLLNALGIKSVYEAADGGSAFNELRDRRPDFVLTDLSMKPMDGIEFTKLVRTATDSPNPYVPIVMVTGHTERNKIETARDAGVTEILAKPITAQNLFMRVAEIIERPRAFVRCASYFGPDRRRRRLDAYPGPWRRHEDLNDEVTIR
jgi:two-component system, chemotaxis family, chemotaxis protein CheY